MSQHQTTEWDGCPPPEHRKAGTPHFLDAGAMPDGSRVRFVALWSGWRWVCDDGACVKPDEAAAFDWRYVRHILEPANAE